MFNQDKSLKHKEAFRKAFSQALGLNLADEVAESLLNSEPLSLEQLSKHHTLTEIGIALVRLDALCEGNQEGPGLCCIPTPWGKCCFPCPNIPPEQQSFQALIRQLGQASSAEIEAVLATREQTEPEAELSVDVVAHLKERIEAGMNKADRS